jgi:alpha-ribazole phosphatase
MEIILVRHTTPLSYDKTGSVSKGVCYGQTDLDVVEGFEDEREVVLSKILALKAGEKQAVIHASPLMRCAKLAHFLGEKLDAIVNFETRLMELNFGAWENRAWNDLPQDDLMLWMNDFVTARPPDGESYDELNERVFNFLKSLQVADNQCVILVTHAGVMRALMAYSAGLPLAKAFDVKLEYGAVCAIEWVS